MKGKLIIISSPSGGGKGTLIREVRKALPDLGYSVSHTTRPKRAGEVHGREYYFTDEAEFRRLIDEGVFLEFAEVHGNLYGTSYAEAEKVFLTGADAIVEVDVQGALNIVERLKGDAISIFILPPSFEVLKMRLELRGTEDENELRTRLTNAFEEVQQLRNVVEGLVHLQYFKYVVVNEDVAKASREIEAIILAERQLLHRQTEVIRGILDSFDDAKRQFEGD